VVLETAGFNGNLFLLWLFINPIQRTNPAPIP